MNLLADEGVDRAIVEQLRKEGHNVLYVAEMSPGIDDDVILRERGGELLDAFSVITPSSVRIRKRKVNRMN